MKIWIVKTGEPLPIDEGDPRIMRAGLLANLLAERGHDVTLWVAKFDHARKVMRNVSSKTIMVSKHFRLKLLDAPGYKKNVSLSRVRHHAALGREFRRELGFEPPPDVIYASYPTMELAEIATDYAKRSGIPSVVDIRDLWPDIFENVVPRYLRWGLRLATRSLRRSKQSTFRAATAIVGTSDAFVRWGLAAAERSAGPFDREFPHAYRLPEPDEHALQQAQQWLDQLLGGDTTSPIVCFFGTFANHVLDLGTLLSAARKLESRNSPIRFVLCGNGDAFQKTLLQADGLRNVHLPGRVGAAQIAVLMQRSFCGVVPYEPRWDFEMSIPNKAIEYLAGGLPVVTCLSGELGNILVTQECGILYRHRDADELADKIEALAHDVDKQTVMRARALEVYLDRFEFKRVYEGLADLVTSVAV
jgi:glycosyltransferase involved in cell wall biosynthesis